MHTHTHALGSHRHGHTHTHAYHTCVHTHTHMHTTHMFTHKHTCTHTHTHALMHTHANSHTHTETAMSGQCALTVCLGPWNMLCEMWLTVRLGSVDTGLATLLSSSGTMGMTVLEIWRHMGQ